MEALLSLWKVYSFVGMQINNSLRTGNVVGDFTEELICDYYGGTLAKPSTKGYDFTANGKKYQVKARMSKGKNVIGNLSDIHNWNFDYLVVIFYNVDGKIMLAKEFTNQQAHAIATNGKNRDLISASSVRNVVNGTDFTQTIKAKYNL